MLGDGYEDRDRKSQLRRCVVACDRLTVFLDEHCDAHAAVSWERAESARVHAVALALSAVGGPGREEA